MSRREGKGSPGLARRVYRAALRLLPDPVRSKHADEMERLFQRHLERAAGRGRIARLRVVLGGLQDVVRRAFYERFRRSPARNSAPGAHRPYAREGLVRGLLHDLRFGARALRRAPRFTGLAVLTLALGIGANVALFSVVHGVVLRPLPFPDADRVVHLAWSRAGTPLPMMPAYKFAFWSERTTSFEAMATWRSLPGEGTGAIHAGSGDDGAPLRGVRVSHGFLHVVGFAPVLGRDFVREDDAPGAPDVALLSHHLWQTRWAGDPEIVGRTVRLDGVPHTVLGVLPAGFAFPHVPGRIDLLLPLRLDADPQDEGENWPIIARLAPGVDRTTAETDLERAYQAFRTQHPELINETDRGMVLASYEELYVGRTGTTLWILMAATVLVLLIACANVAALLLARGSSRRVELAVRSALGAGSGRIARQILSESLLLALMGAGAGLALAYFGVDLILDLYPGRLPRTEWIGLNGVVLGYATLAALGTAAAFGLVALVPVIRNGVAPALRRGRGSRGGRGGVRKTVLAVEAAVSMVLLVGSGLLVATVAEIRNVDPGFQPEGLLATPLPEPSEGWEAAGGRDEVQRRLLGRLRALPGVVEAAAASTHPLRRGLNIPVGIQGRPDAYEGAVEWRAVSPGYLETLGVPLLEGRAFRESDEGGAPYVAMVNRAFAERYFPGESAVGRRIEIGRYRDRYVEPELDVGGVEIVGVIGDIRERSLKYEPRRMVLVPRSQTPEVLASTPILLIRVAAAGAIPTVREELASVSPGGRAFELRRMEEVISASLARERFNALLMSTFALVALVLTAFGVYGIASYSMRQRKREIGIRIALGARRREVLRLVAREGLAPVLVGLGVGIALALGLTRFLTALLWGVEPTDPLTIGSVAAILALVALLSSWIPAREATSIDPRRSLQQE